LYRYGFGWSSLGGGNFLLENKALRTEILVPA
jgi:hypothetical protein